MAEKTLTIYIRGNSKDVVNAFGQVNKGIQTMQQKLQSAGQTMTSFGTKMSLAVTAPLVLIGKKSLEMAVDVVESENLFTVSLGKMEDAAREWSKTFSESVGLNEYEVRRQAGIFDVMLKSMGLTEEAAFDMSKGFTELAYDMASFYNLKPEEAFEKLSSGIVGMPRPLQDLGIVVNESTVQIYAYKNGIAAAGEELTEAQKVLARYGAIMERTSAAQGDMARTLESPANQMRIFKEQVNLAMISLGQGLIPVMQKVLTTVQPWIEKFKDLTDIQKEWIVKIAIAAAAAGPLALMTGQILVMASGIMKLRSSILAANAAGKTSFLFSAGVAGTSVTAMALMAAGVDKLANKIDDPLLSTFARLIYPLAAVKNGIEDNILVAKGLKEGLITVSEAANANIFNIGELADRVRNHTELTKEEVEGLRDLYDTTEIANIKLAMHAKAQREAANATEETTEETEKQVVTLNELISALWKVYNINQSVTEATWDFEDSIKEAEKVLKDSTSTDREKEKVLFAVQDKYESLQLKIIEGMELDNLTMKKQGELQQTYLETGAKMVEMGIVSRSDFEQTAISIGINQKFITDKLLGLDAGLDTSTLKTKGLKAAIEELRSKDIYINTYHTDWFSQANVKPGEGNFRAGSSKQTQSGGLMANSLFSSDLNIPLFKGEAVLPSYIVKAIKENRGSFAGLDTGGGGSVTNYFNISSLVVREEADIEKIAQDLYSMQLSSLRGAGIR